MKKIMYIMLTLIILFSLSLTTVATPYTSGYDYIYDDYDYYTDDDYGYYDDYSADEDYEESSADEEPFNYAKSIGISVVIGLVIALIVTLVLKSQLNNVHKQESANTYVRAGSMMVTESRDLYLYRNVIRTEKPQSNKRK